MNSNSLNEKIWLTTAETATYLGKTRNALWLLVSRGLLSKRKWQGRLYFKRAEIDRLLEGALT
jgi:hypothetical protein